MLEHTPATEHHFHLRRPDRLFYDTRDICYADDRQSLVQRSKGISVSSLHKCNCLQPDDCDLQPARVSLLWTLSAPYGTLVAPSSHYGVGIPSYRTQCPKGTLMRSLVVKNPINPEGPFPQNRNTFQKT